MVIAYLLAFVTFALIATSAVMLLRQYRAETAPAREAPPEAPADAPPDAPAEPASEHQPPAETPPRVDPPPEPQPPVDPSPEAPPPADPPPNPSASDAPAGDAPAVTTRSRGTVPARREGVAERVAPPSPDPAPAPRAAARRAAPPMPAPEAAEFCQVHWLGRGRGSCFAAVTVDAKGVKHTLATSRRVEWRDSAPPTETPQSQAAVRQLSRILRDNGWEPLRGNGADLGQERWYARRFRRTAGAGPGGRRAPTRTARTGDAA